MILADVDSWPKELLDFLEAQYDMLLAHARHDTDSMREYLAPNAQHIPRALMPPNPFWYEREQAAVIALELLQSTELHGWHCTRLTEPEIANIKQHGMRLPNLQLLRERVSQVKANGFVDQRIANRLLNENQVDDQNRKDMIWFCFFPPRLAEQSGIERFFRRWGGEALYGSHEADSETGELLKTIGTPCLIEANVPISMFGSVTFLSEKVIRQFLLSRGFDTGECVDHEDKAREPIPAENIVRVIRRDETEFADLTNCNEWRPPL